VSFRSILFGNSSGCPPASLGAALDFVVDLNLDQIVAAVIAGREEYNLASYFYTPLRDVDSIVWRHEIIQDLEKTNIFDSIKCFAQKMRIMRERLGRSEKLHYQLQKRRWFLDAVDIYCDGLIRLVEELSASEVTSRGLLAFREYLSSYVMSQRFRSLFGQVRSLKADLAAIDYTVLINGSYVEVGLYDNELDYTTEVESTFEKFKQEDVAQYEFRSINDWPEMNHVEARILHLVAKLHASIFSRLADHCSANADYLDKVIAAFDREIQFYIAYLERIAPLKEIGLSFCYPRVSGRSKEVYDDQCFDLALALKLTAEHKRVICNDFFLRDRERIIVVSGPNQGGKTTFARTIGQLHYLASLGLPVPGACAQLFLFDEIFTHFEREEHIESLRGKLEDDLVRIHKILERATADSIVLVNEIFTSTTLRDAIMLSKRIAEKLIALDMICVWVTFIDELASLGEKTVSMVSTVVPENPAVRTYKIVRRPADGLAYALSLAEKYRLTNAQIRERIAS
jgi:DNA mismatch repair protein MutS